LAGVIASAGAKDWWHQPLANPPTDFVVGYGSLINTPSRNSTAKKNVPAIPVRVSAALGYLRAWNSHADGFTAQGLRKPGPGEASMTINGVLFAVDDKDIAGFDHRECRYHRAEVKDGQIEAVGWQGLPRGGRIWIYVPNQPGAPGCQGDADPAADRPDFEHPLLQSYIDVVLEAGLEYGEDFAREILETTADWRPFWLNDRELARRPWVHDANAAKVDDLLKTTPGSGTILACRSFPEFYAARLSKASAKCGTAAK
jgi:hypothetical protein